MTTITPTTTLADYLAMWAETDADVRRAIIERVFTPDGRYCDPVADARGHAAINEMVSGVLAHYVGHRFEATTAIDAHHDQARVGWQLVAPDGTAVVTGIDIATFASDGQLVHMTGFFGPLE